MICPTGRAEYFCAEEWTVESALMLLAKFGFSREALFVIPGRERSELLCIVCT
jgi:hypothetical protein